MKAGRCLAFACVLASIYSTALSQWFYVPNSTRIYRAPVTNPTEMTLVGSNGFAGQDPSAITNLTYHPTAGLVGLIYLQVSSAPEQFLVRINAQTGAGTILASLGLLSTSRLFEGLEYHSGLGSLIATRQATIGSSMTSEVVSMALDGSVNHLSDLSRDIEFMTYHGGLGRLYGWSHFDSQVSEIDPLTGSIQSRGSLPLGRMGDGAYARTDGFLYGLRWDDNRWFRMLIDGNGNSSFQLIGNASALLATSHGAAFVPVPEPMTWLVLLGACMASKLKTRRRQG